MEINVVNVIIIYNVIGKYWCILFNRIKVTLRPAHNQVSC